jgi:predicted metalloprotease with PDZ domain
MKTGYTSLLQLRPEHIKGWILGRFVKSFAAYDESGNEIETKQELLNQWGISDPGKVKKIVYEIEDTWDTPVDSDRIYLMCGSSIENDNVLINGQCVFGYFHGMQSEPILVKIKYPEDWLLGTALQLNEEGYYEAESYDYIVDSPILLGKLTKESITISNANVDVFTYSKTGLLKSSDILGSIEDILKAEDAFTNGLPVDHYTFLFHFEDVSAGAWEHSYSSEYIYKEDSLSERLKQSIRDVVAHEFFHIVTPLNIHSELIEEFNFVKPELSQHLWLYEGVTEWASHILELRDSLISLEDYLKVLHNKLSVSEAYDKNISLTYLGVNSTELQDQYINIYFKGALVAGLLDIRLLELSDGKRGLREIINELSKKYGPYKPFNEETFFDDLTAMTYPEISDFFEKYIKGTESLPVKEYYENIGINYFEKGDYDSSKVSLGILIGFNGSNFFIEKVSDQSPGANVLKAGDIIDKVEGEPVTTENVSKIFARIRTTYHVGDSVNMTVLRDNTSLDLEIKLTASRNKHVFFVNENATEEQVKLRNAWLRNI